MRQNAIGVAVRIQTFNFKYGNLVLSANVPAMKFTGVELRKQARLHPFPKLLPA